MNKILIGALSTAVAITFSGCATTANTAKTPDAAVDAFLRDYVGVQFGDDISKINGYEDAQYMIPMKKNFQYFDKACVYYRNGKLFRVNIWTDIGKEYSQVSTEAQMKKSLSALEAKLCLPQNYFTHHSRGDYQLLNDDHTPPPTETKLTYAVWLANKDWPNFRRYCIDIIDTELEKSLQSDKGADPKYEAVTNDTRKNWGLSLPDPD